MTKWRYYSIMAKGSLGMPKWRLSASNLSQLAAAM
jgi:hypothetical protein